MSINKEEEREILEKLFEMNDKFLFVAVMNYYQTIKSISGDMVKALNLLDAVYEDGDKKAKEELRKTILDNFNDLPRETCSFIEEITEILKE